MPAILLLAAGASSRMRGRDKLLELIDGEPQLTRIARAATLTGAQVFVSLPRDHPERQRALSGLKVSVLMVDDAAEGMAASIRAGATAAKYAAGLMILPADMPDLDMADLARAIKAFTQEPSRIWRATTSDGRLGHPVIFPASALSALAELTGDTGARQILATQPDQIRSVSLPDLHAITDLDTPEDWDKWRSDRR